MVRRVGKIEDGFVTIQQWWRPSEQINNARILNMITRQKLQQGSKIVCHLLALLHSLSFILRLSLSCSFIFSFFISSLCVFVQVYGSTMYN